MTAIQICDCTLRDGGYYTNWDFDQDLVQGYFKAMNAIPAVTHLEIGYRSKANGEYLGEYFYCPEHVMQLAKSLCPNKTLAIMLNEKDTTLEQLNELLAPCLPYIGLVRMAVDPKNLKRALTIAKAIKAKGFQVGFNLMYMSQWATNEQFIAKLQLLKGDVDYIYLVDSFGGVYPQDIATALRLIKKSVNIPIGFHGHNNMELGLANSLSAIDHGCQVIDATITGMGRGAGNLKTELLLTCLNSQEKIHFDFNQLNPIVSAFEKLQQSYQWGTSLPYMISGAYSLPQKDVMSWISKRRYTTESIINALQNQKNKLPDNITLPLLNGETKAQQAIIVGGGPSASKHAHALARYCEMNPEVVLIHAGVRNVELFTALVNRQYYCLLGSEGYKLKTYLSNLNMRHTKCIVEPSPRKMGTILPDEIHDKTYELKEISFLKEFPDSLLTIAFQLCIHLHTKEVLLFGMDGYDQKTDEEMLEVSAENQLLINAFLKVNSNIKSFTPTNYSNLPVQSIYSFI